MAKITFTKVNIENNQNNFVKLSVQKFNFPTSKGDKEIENISFEGSSGKGISKKDELEAILKKGENQNLELSFGDDKVEIIVIESQPQNNNVCCAMGPEPVDQPLKIRVFEDSKTLNIEYNPDIIKIVAGQQEAPNQTPTDEKKPGSPKPGTPKTPDQNPSPDNPNEGPSDPAPKQPDKSPDKKDNPTPQDTPPKNPEPSSEEVDSAKNKLKQARESSNKDEMVSALNDTRDTVEKSSNQDLKKEKKLTEDELGKLDEKKLREIIREEVAKELQKFGVKPDDLSSENKQKLDELNNNNNNNNNIKPEEAKNIRSKVLNEAGKKSLDKLINELEQAIETRKSQKEIENKIRALQQFIGDNSNEYAQNAYSRRKDKVQKLLEKAKNQSKENNEKRGFFRSNNPVM